MQHKTVPQCDRHKIRQCLLAAAIAMAIQAPAFGFEIHNTSPYSIRAKVTPGDFDEVIPPGDMRSCSYTNTDCNPTGEQTASLTLVVETLDSNDQDFMATVELLGGAQAYVHRETRSEMGLEPLLYVDSWNVPGDALVDDSRLGTGQTERSVRFLASADCQYQHPGTTAAATDWPVADATNQRMKSMTLNKPNRIRGILYAGDLTQNARRDEWEHYKSEIGSMGEFFYDGMGNHDLANDRPCVTTSPAGCTIRDEIAETIRDRKHRTTKTNKAPGDDPHYSWDWDDVHFVQLNLFPGNAPSTGRPEDDSGTTLDPADALTFLVDDLAQHVGSSGRPVVLVHHYGFDEFSVGSNWWTTAERNAYWDAIAGYNVIGIFTGHQHLAETSTVWRFDFERPSGAAGPGLIPTFVTGGAINGVFLDVEINDDDQMIVTRRFNDGRQLDQELVKFGPDDFIDGAQSNDDCFDRFSLGGAMDISIEDLRVYDNDEDWYSVHVPSGSTLNIDLSFLHDYGDIDLEVIKVCGLSAVESATSTDDNETLSWTNTGSTSVETRIRVFMKSGEGSNTYDFDLSIGGDALEENDICSTPKPLAMGVHNDLSVQGDDEDWYRVSVPAASLLTVVMTQFDSFNDVKIEVWNACNDSSPNPSQSNANLETATFSNDGPARDVWVRVYMVQPLGFSSYRLSISSGALDGGDCDDAELILGAGSLDPREVFDGADDWYLIDTEPGVQYTVELAFQHAIGNIDLEFWNECGGARIQASASVTDNESLSYLSAGGEDLYIRVLMADPGGLNQYTLSVTTHVTYRGDDLCENATPISGVKEFQFDNTGATRDGSFNPLCQILNSDIIDHDVWFDWTATVTGTATLSICSSSTQVDTKIAVYEGVGCTGAILACDDDSCDAKSEVTFPVTVGEQYKLRIGTYESAQPGTGSFTISVEDAFGPNTECSEAIELSPGTYSDLVLPPQDSTDNTDWWTTTVPPNTRVVVDLLYDSGVQFLAGADFELYRAYTPHCSGTVPGGLVIDPISSGLRILHINTVGTNTYSFKVKNDNNVEGANYTLRITHTTVDDHLEPNDTCETPAATSPGFYTDLRCADDDYYAISMPETSILDVDAFFAQADGDLSLLLYGPCEQQLALNNTSTDDESLRYVNTGPARTVMVRVVRVTPTGIVPYAMNVSVTDIDDCNGNGIDDPIEIANQLTDDCNSNGIPDACDMEPPVLNSNLTGIDDSVWLGVPDDNWVGIGTSFVTYDFGGARVVDGPGSDFNVYEADTGVAEFDKIIVLVKGPTGSFIDITATASPVVRIPGDEQHGNDAFARSYDIAASGLTDVRYISVDGVGVTGPAGGTNGFDLDAIGAIYVAPSGCDVLFDGDMNCDGFVDMLDASLFVTALVDPASFAIVEPFCPMQRADVNRDGLIDGNDAQGFVELLLMP